MSISRSPHLAGLQPEIATASREAARVLTCFTQLSRVRRGSPVMGPFTLLVTEVRDFEIGPIIRTDNANILTVAIRTSRLGYQSRIAEDSTVHLIRDSVQQGPPLGAYMHRRYRIRFPRISV
jgi:hypothetical protein